MLNNLKKIWAAWINRTQETGRHAGECLVWDSHVTLPHMQRLDQQPGRLLQILIRYLGNHNNLASYSKNQNSIFYYKKLKDCGHLGCDAM